MKNVHVSQASQRLTQDLPIEIVERKGLGHPDTICDALAEELSVNLSKHYVKEFGRVLHHNVDKCVLAGGQSEAGFGKGRLTKPLELVMVGRAVQKIGKKKVPLDEFVQDGSRNYLETNFPHLNAKKDVKIRHIIHPGSVDLVGVFNAAKQVPKSNDTSFGVAYAPFTDLEKCVKEAEKYLNSGEAKKKFPEIGQDVKVMGVRNGRKVELIVAAAFISSKTPNKSHYQSVKQDAEEAVQRLCGKITDLDVSARMNTADDYKKGIYYLTATGLSAENGDDGQVGRGNRANGLITPYRPMTLEATAGKNPVSHVGKLYNVAANEIVQRVVKGNKYVMSAQCYIVSQIGAPINQPKALNVEIIADGPVNVFKDEITQIANEVMDDLPNYWKGFIEKKYELF